MSVIGGYIPQIKNGAIITVSEHLPFTKKHKGEKTVIHTVEIGHIVFVSEELFKQKEASHPMDWFSTKR